MTVETVELDADELEQLRADLASVRRENAALRSGVTTDPAEVEHLREQNRRLREVNVRLGRAQADNDQLNQAVRVMAGERDTARAELKEALNRIAGIRETNRRLSAKWQGYAEQARQRQIRADNLQRQLDDANATIIAASEDRLIAQSLSRALDKATTDNRRARVAAERLLHMEREHTGSGREGHLSEADLRPLLHAVGIDPEEQP